MISVRKTQTGESPDSRQDRRAHRRTDSPDRLHPPDSTAYPSRASRAGRLRIFDGHGLEQIRRELAKGGGK